MTVIRTLTGLGGIACALASAIVIPHAASALEARPSQGETHRQRKAKQAKRGVKTLYYSSESDLLKGSQ